MTDWPSRDRQTGDAAADLGFNHRLELGLHCADDFLHRRLLHCFNPLHANNGRRQAFAGRCLRFVLLAAANGERHDARKEQAARGG